MATHCTALVIHCTDYRFQKAIAQYLADEELIGDCDIISVTGGVKGIADPEKPEEAAFLMRQVELVMKLHGPKMIMLLNHLDCGAYGGTSAFPSVEDEVATHAKHLRDAAAKIREKYPDTAVKKFIAHMDDAKGVALEEVP